MIKATLLVVAARVFQTRQLGLLALWTAALGALLLLWSRGHVSPSLFALVSCAFGGLSVLMLVEWFWLFPLRQMVSACHEIEKGHLDVVAPEQGASEVKAAARIINDMAADFQEVLLLTAHGSNEIRKAAEALELRLSAHCDPSISQRNLSEMLDMIRQTSEVIQEFKYFRVVVGKDSISDVGIVKATGSTEGSRHGSLRAVGLDMACTSGSRKTGE